MVNLGKEDGMQPDMRFEIYSQLDDTKKKALVVTSAVMDKVSEARILEQDITKPIAIGDVLRGYISKRGKETFVLAGKFGEEMLYSKSELQKLIESRGGKVQEEVDLDTDYLVLGDYTSDPTDPAVQEGLHQRDLALKLNVGILTYERFLEFYE